MIETIFLVLSVSANILLLLYSRWLINIVRVKEEEAESLSIIVNEYVNHVRSVHEMEMFYGDETLKSLISHGSDLIEKVQEFDYIVLTPPDDVEAPND